MAKSPVLLACILSFVAGTACSSGADRAAPPPGAHIPPQTPIVPTPEPTATATPVVEPTVWPLPCNDLYDPAKLPTFDLEITPEVWSALVDDFHSHQEVYRPATFRFEDETYPGAM